VLCWSECYHGTWQPTRTSDIDKPTRLDESDVTGSGAFDRSMLRLFAIEESGSLRVFITHRGTRLYSWFVLHHSHSLPVRREDEIRERDLSSARPEGSTRTLNAFQRPLLAVYRHDGMSFIRPVLITKTSDEVTGELYSDWRAPFLYWDPQYAFYVTTRDWFEPISDRNVYGLAPDDGVTDIPSLVLQDELDPDTERRDPTALDGPDDAGMLDPDSARRFTSSDSDVDKALGIQGHVNFGETRVGPEGHITRNFRR
jgi:hypothetical protein